MFENRSQQSKTEANARTERSQNSSHEQTFFLLKKTAGRIPETTRIMCIIICILTLPKSEHQNRQAKKVTQQTTIKCFKNADILLGVGELGGWWGR